MTEKISSSSKMQKSIISLVDFRVIQGKFNADIRLDSTVRRSMTGNGSYRITKTSASGASAYISNPQLVAGETYTISAYVKRSNLSGSGGARLAVYENTLTQGANTLQSNLNEISSSNYCREDDSDEEWVRIQTSFIASSNNCAISLELRDATGTVWFDDIQLENSEVANRFNYVTDAMFNWNYFSRSNTNSTDTTVAITPEDYLPDFGGKAFKITGEYSKNKSIYQIIKIAGKQGDNYTFGGWAKANSIPKRSTGVGLFRMRFGFKKTNGTYTYTDVDFSQNIKGWQYACGGAVAPEDYTEVSITFEYSRNLNEAYFAYPQVYREEFSQSFTYDDEGNVVSVSALADRKSEFEWNGNNDLPCYGSSGQVKRGISR